MNHLVLSEPFSRPSVVPSARMPADPDEIAVRRRGRAVRATISPRELLIGGLYEAALLIVAAELAGRPWLSGRKPGRIRAAGRARLVAAYACHVIFGVSITEVARAAGMHRSTVSRGCALIEDLRDDAGFDALVGAVERSLAGLALTAGGSLHG